jgi:hypothetical protein
MYAAPRPRSADYPRERQALAAIFVRTTGVIGGRTKIGDQSAATRAALIVERR